MGYDADDARMTFRFVAGSDGLRAADLASAVEVERRGRLAPGQPVEEVWVVFGSDEEAAAFAPLVLELGLVPALQREGHGETLAWELEHE